MVVAKSSARCLLAHCIRNDRRPRRCKARRTQIVSKPSDFMSTTNEPARFITDEAGNRIAVILDLDRYEELMEALEDLEDIRAFDEAKASGDEAIPFEQAVQEVERAR